jgi:hypothetical protein
VRSSALPDFLLSAVCLYTWPHPMTFDPQLVKRLTVLTLLEFVIVHSAPFTGLVALSELKTILKTAALVGLGAFYMLFAWGFSVGFDSNWPAIAFFALMLNRLLPVLLGAVPSSAQKTFMATCWGLGVVAYLGTIFAAALLPIPALGITADVIAAQHFTSGGMWPEQPYRALFMGTVLRAGGDVGDRGDGGHRPTFDTPRARPALTSRIVRARGTRTASRMRRQFLAGVTCALALAACERPPQATTPTRPTLEALFARFAAPACQGRASSSRHDSVLVRESFGLSDVAGNVAATPATNYRPRRSPSSSPRRHPARRGRRAVARRRSA